MEKKIKAVYAGTFDPVTNGHIDIIERASKLFDEVYVVVSININKKTLFTLEERLTFLKEVIQHLDNVVVEASEKLTVDYAKSKGASVLVRGLRNSVDYEYETNLTMANQYLEKDIDTIYLPTNPLLRFVSSSNIKEMAMYHRDVSDLVPECVSIELKKKMNKADS